MPEPEARSSPGVGRGRRPVEVGVSGAGALLLGGGAPEGARVDVVVSQPAGLGNKARTYIAARGVRLLALEGPGGPGEGWTATLALTRRAGARADLRRFLGPADPAAARAEAIDRLGGSARAAPEGLLGLVAVDGEDDALEAAARGEVAADLLDLDPRCLLEREATDAGAEGDQRERSGAELVGLGEGARGRARG